MFSRSSLCISSFVNLVGKLVYGVYGQWNCISIADLLHEREHDSFRHHVDHCTSDDIEVGVDEELC